MLRWLPVLGWMGVIFVVSSQPDLPGPPDPLLDLLLKKGAHLAEYAVLGFLLGRATGGPRGAWLIGVLYGVSDEIHQAFVPGRQARPADVLIDALGTAAGVWGWLRLLGARRA